MEPFNYFVLMCIPCEIPKKSCIFDMTVFMTVIVNLYEI